MITESDTTLDAQLMRFRNYIRPSVPSIDDLAMKFCDAHDFIVTKGKWAILASQIGDVSGLRMMFDLLLRQGKSWVHLAAEGKLPDDSFLVSVDYNPASFGCSATAVNMAGLPIGVDGQPREYADINILEPVLGAA